MKIRRGISLLLSVVLLLGLFCGVPQAFAASDMTTSEACVDLIKELEGFSEYPYYDYGQWTVGYGTRCPDEDKARYEKDGITEAEAEKLMQAHIEEIEDKLNSFLSSNKLTLKQNQFDALVSFTYNLGTNWMNNDSQIRTAVLEKHTGNDFISAISRWCTANGEILVSLVERRLAEANLYLNGAYDVKPPKNYRYVIFDANLEDAMPDILIQGYDATATDHVRAKISKNGYEFLGWYTQYCGGQKVTKLDKNTTMTTLYAHWKTESGELLNDQVEDSIATGLVTADKLNVRKGAGTDYEVVGSLYNGDRVFILEYKTVDGVRWGKISRGWISMDYVKLDNGETGKVPEEPVPEETEPEPTEPEETQPEPTEPEDKKEPVIATGTVVNCSALRIRKGPGTNYAQVGTLMKGTAVEIYETASVKGTVWGRIDKGWICVTNYVKLNETQAPPADSDSGSDNGSEQKPAGKMTGTVTASALNIRAGAGTNFAKVGSLSKGTKVEILETTTVSGATWGRMEKGWVHMGYIKLDANSGTTPDGSGNNSGSSSGNDSGSSSGGTSSDTGSDNTSGGTASGNTSGATGKITGADWLRVRSGPGTNYAKVDSLARGTKVTIYEIQTVNGTDWGRISQGWICMTYVTMDKGAVVPGTVKTVTASSLNIRSGPGTSYEKVGSYSKGNKVEILETKVVGSTTWGKTDKGWISLDYVS